jgi:3-oxoacyl-[acyl-carrier protein] reductase
MKFLKNFFQLQNKVIIITGCNGQLGSSLVDIFLELGSIVIGIDNAENSKIKNKDFYFYSCDISKQAKAQSLFAKLFLKFKNIHCLVNNAGVSIFEPFELRKSKDLDKVIDVNLKGTFFCIQNFIKQKKNKTGKSIINISSIYSLISPDPRIYAQGDRKNSEIYGATKAGINQMTKYFAVHLSKKNIRVNAVSPGGIFNEKNPQSAKFIKKYSMRNPMGRMAKIEEITGAIIYLASTSSSYINGQNIIIDGGMSAW